MNIRKLEHNYTSWDVNISIVLFYFICCILFFFRPENLGCADAYFNADFDRT